MYNEHNSEEDELGDLAGGNFAAMCEVSDWERMPAGTASLRRHGGLGES